MIARTTRDYHRQYDFRSLSALTRIQKGSANGTTLMAEENKLDAASLKTLSLTLVDVLGVLVPGFVWLSLLSMLVHIVLTGNADLTAEYSIARRIFTNSSTVFQSAVLIMLLGTALIIGYMAKAFAMGIAGQIESFFLGAWSILTKPSVFGTTRKQFFSQILDSKWQFPYSFIHEGQAYFVALTAIVVAHSALDKGVLPGKVFGYCKRLTKVMAPELWAEGQQLEAEVRMMGSLFLAGVLGVVIALLSFAISRDPKLWRVALLTSFLTIAFGVAFSRLRKQQVVFTYLNAVIAWSENEKRKAKDQQVKVSFLE